MANVVGVRFKRACPVYSFDENNLGLRVYDNVIVETEKGMAMGYVAAAPVEKDEAGLSQPLKKVIRKAADSDLERLEFNREREKEAAEACKRGIEKYGLAMKLVNVEYFFDSSKVIFAFTSENRVDFRDLIKDLASELHIRIEMRQIGVRDEAKMLGGIGPCGRTLCCATHLVDFEPVSIKMAREQNIALNPAKLSGLCGRLMCCLSYEAAQGSAGASGGCCGSDNSPASEEQDPL